MSCVHYLACDTFDSWEKSVQLKVSKGGSWNQKEILAWRVSGSGSHQGTEMKENTQTPRSHVGSFQSDSFNDC